MTDTLRRLASLGRRTLRAGRDRLEGMHGARCYLDEVAPRLPSKRSRTVAVIVDARTVRHFAAWRDALSGSRPHVLYFDTRPAPVTLPKRTTVVTSLDQASMALKLLGPVDLLIDDRRTRDEAASATWSRLYFHCTKRGAYLVVRPPGPIRRRPAWVAGLARAATRGDALVSGETRELLKATSEIQAASAADVFHKKWLHRLKVSDAEADAILPRRGGKSLRSKTFATVPGEDVRPSVMTSYDAPPGAPAPLESIRAPRLHLRTHRGRLILTGPFLTISGATVLPASFRYPDAPALFARRLITVSPEFGRVSQRSLTKVRSLPGRFFDISSVHPNHYGHFMTEAVPKLWGWDEAKRRVPGIKALIKAEYADLRLTFQRELLNAYGIADEEIEVVHGPLSIDKLVAATPMWQNQEPFWVHPQLKETWSRLSAGLIGNPVPATERLFVSRPPTLKNRPCANTAEIEAFFRHRGFTVVYPETMTVAEQARLFSGARVLAGFGGSGMFNACFSHGLESLIVLNHVGYRARNEQLYAAVLGADTHYFWGIPELTRDAGADRKEAMQSSWSFDLEANRPALESLLQAV